MSTYTERQLLRYAVLGIAAVVLIFTVVLNIQRLPIVGEHQTTYDAEFADASGLVSGEDVTVAGVSVGRVTDIRLDHGKVLVQFEVSGIAVGAFTTARIEVKTLLGQHSLSLEPSGPPLPDGGTIPLAHTSTPINIVPALNTVAGETAQLDTTEIGRAFDSLSEILQRTAPNLRPTLDGLSRLSEVINARNAQVRSLLASANTVSSTVAARDQDLVSLLRSAAEVSTTLASRRAAINELINGASLLARELRGVVQENSAILRPALEKLNGVLAILVRDRAQIDNIVNNAYPYVRSFTNVGGTGQWFDSTIATPQGFALCTEPNPGNPINNLLSTVFSAFNKQINGSTQTCLPFGPAAGGSK